MMRFPQALSDVIYFIDSLPGIGPKTSQRLAVYLLRLGPSYIESFSKALLKLKEELRLCSSCRNFSTGQFCAICLDKNRDQGVVCVVADIMDLMAIENTGKYSGLYHILNGEINPLEGVTARDLRIEELIKRAEAAAVPVKEIILGLDADTKGDATSLYLISKLKDKNIKLTRLGRGLPTGSDLEYADVQTLSAALEGRREYV